MRLLRGRFATPRGAVIALSSTTYFTTALGFISAPILARSLGPAGRGEVATATAYSLLAAAILGLGVPSAAAHALGARRYDRREVLATAVLFTLMITPLAMLCAVAAVTGPLRGFTHAGRTTTFLLVCASPIYVLQLCLQSFLVTAGAVVSLSKVQLFSAVTLTVTVIILAITGTITSLNYGIGYAAVIGAASLYSWKFVALRPRLKFHLVPLLRFGVKAAPAGLASFVTLRLDQVLVASLLGAEQVGVYAVAVSVASIPNALGYAIALAAYGNVASGFVVGDEEGLYRSARAIRATFVATGAVAAIVFLSTPLGLPILFGSRFGGAMIPLLILLPGSMALAVSLTAHSVLIARGRPLAASGGEVMGLLATVVGLLVFVPQHGIIAAAVVSTIAYTATMTTFLVLLRRMGARNLLPRPIDARDIVVWIGQKLRLSGRSSVPVDGQERPLGERPPRREEV